jgi:phosphoenolpyruvate carboxylase
MGLEKSIETLEDIPEGIQGLYREREEGGYELAFDPQALEDAVAPSLKSALQKERQNAKQRDREAKELKRKLESLGEDDPESILEELSSLRQFKESAEKSRGKDDNAVEQVRKQLQEEFGKTLSKKEAEAAQLKGQLTSLLVDSAATAAISELKGVPKLLLPHVKRMTEVVEEDGKYDVRVLNEKGEHRVNSNGDYLTIKELVTELRSDDVFQRAFDGEGASGGGIPSGGPRGGGAATKKRSQMAVAEKSEYIEKHGMDSYLSLPY